jgi:type I restriction enzyme R subunit
MIFAANKLYNDPRLENPSVFFIVDRIDLEDQLYREYNALDIVEPEIIGSIDDLRKVLEFDEYKGKRGVFITLIHKFRIEELLGLQKDLEEKSETQETVLSRKNVLAFLDEGHRTQYGMLAAQMKGILKNAFFFAFTGTPVAKTGKDTYREFAYPPEELYLDKYFVTESLRDKFTVKIAYQPRLEKDVHLKKDLLELFLKIEAEEIPEKARSVVEEKVKKKLNPINMFLEDPGRIEKVAADIAEHYLENVDGKFKAMVVAASRKACVSYKKSLDKLLLRGYSEIVMTYNRDDDKEIREYHKELTERFKGLEDDKIKKDIVEKYLEEENPKILIVTDMLLAGFDAPILQTMYLDKPLKEHRLLQAIARTNRPYKDVKEAGKIIDYVGILDQINKAFANYAKEDYENALFSIDDIKSEFRELINEMLSLFKDVEKRKYDRATLLKAVEILTTDEETGKEFLENYKHLRKIFELLGSDISKLDFFEDYKWLSSVYTYYMRFVLSEKESYEGYVQKYFAKTVRVVHESTAIYGLEKELPVVDFDERYLLRLEEEAMNTEEKAANIVFTLNRMVLVEKNKNPIFESVAEKVERIVNLWKEKTKDFERIYKEGAEVLNQIDHLTERQKRLSFNEFEYALLLVLEKRTGESNDLVNEVKELSKQLKTDMFTGWLAQSTARKNAEGKIRRFVRKFVKEHYLDINLIDEIYLELMEKLKNYEP